MSVRAHAFLRVCLCGNDYISLLLPHDWSASVWFDSVCLGAPAEAVTLCEGERKREGVHAKEGGLRASEGG